MKERKEGRMSKKMIMKIKKQIGSNRRHEARDERETKE